MEIRIATMADCSTITRLVAESARGLGKPDYTDKVIEAVLKGIWGWAAPSMLPVFVNFIDAVDSPAGTTSDDVMTVRSMPR